MERQPLIENNEREFAPYAKILRRDLERAILVASEMRGELNIEKSRDLLISQIRRIFPDKEHHAGGLNREVFENFLQQLSSVCVDIQDKQELINLLVNMTVKFLSKIFDVNDFEALLQKEFMHATLFPIKLNRSIAYEVSEDEIEIHIFPTITSDPFELKRIIVDAFRQLAQKIRVSDGFDRADKVVGHSWIVKKYPRLVKSLGFNISPAKDDDTSVGAEISKEKFLELYG